MRLGRFAQLMAQAGMISLMTLAITFPPITISPDLPRVKAEQILLPVIFSAYILLLLAGLVRPMRFHGMFLCGIFFCFAVIMSMLYGADILRYRLLPRDYYEIPKAWFPVAFFIVAYESDLSENSLRRLLKILAVPVLLVCLYSWGQFLHVPLTHPLDAYYSGGEHIDIGLERNRRVFSTMGNPNVLGELMTWMLTAYVMAFLLRVGNRTWNIVVAFACFVTLVMTGSRYGLLTSVLGLALIFRMATTMRRRRLTPLLILMLLLPLFGWAFSYVGTRYEVTQARFQELKKPLEVRSVRDRLDDLWLDALAYIKKSPIVGNGPAKILFTGVYTDSEDLNILKYYGVLGFLPYISYYVFPIYLIRKGLKAGQRAGPALEDHLPATYLVMRLGMIMGVTALVMNIGEFTYLNGELQGFLWMWLGLAARTAKVVVNAANVARPAVASARADRVLPRGAASPATS